MYDLILFDLDGTLLDTSKGVFNSVRYAEETLKLSPISDEKLREFVGPPPLRMYQEVYGLTEEMALKATESHRKYGAERAIYEARPYDGIIDLLGTLKKSGHRLGVATLKKQEIAEAILKNFDMDRFFDIIVGMDAEESYSKRDTILIATKKMSSKNPLLIGDSIYDYDGAKEAGITFLGVTYGFGIGKEENYPFPTANNSKDIAMKLGIL